MTVFWKVLPVAWHLGISQATEWRLSCLISRADRDPRRKVSWDRRAACREASASSIRSRLSVTGQKREARPQPGMPLPLSYR